MRIAAAELRPLSRTGVAAILLFLAAARPAVGQETPLVAGDARAFVTAEIATTRLAGEWTPQAGGRLELHLSSRILVGGAARIGLTSPTFERVGSSVRLHFGYAGVAIGVLPEPVRWPGLRLGALLGGGNADAMDPALGTLLDSDNGIVVEPSAAYALRLHGRASMAASAAWRYAAGFSLLGGVRSRDLRGFSAAFGITLGPF